MTTTKYRPDIDGLRAIAVMCVVLFHIKISFISGGFVGVDVFFVISGFLITGLILKDLNAGSFNFYEFYLRRARRLFPALFVTLLVVLCVAVFLFLPHHLERLGGALASAVLWVSNIYFWSESGYFDAGASMKPLLHTWSLGVEEQFYIFWPAFLAALFVLRRIVPIPLLIAVISIVSLIYAEYWLRINASTAFFLAPFRVYEFGLGALTVWAINYRPKSQLWHEALLLLGLGLIAYAVLSYDKATEFPGVSALLPCIGSVLIIYCRPTRIGNILLCNPLSVYIGRISYSLYLVHWPIVVFYKYGTASFTRYDKLIAVTLMFTLAAMMYHFIETPLRRPKSKTASSRNFILGSAASAVFLVIFATHTWMNNGWPNRFDLPASILEISANQADIRASTWEFISNRKKINKPSFSTNETQTKVLLVGDSHSKDIFNAIYLNKQDYNWIDIRRIQLNARCLYLFVESPTKIEMSAEKRTACKKDLEIFKNSELTHSADWIVYSNRWNSDHINFIPNFNHYIKTETNARLALFGRTAEFADIPQLAARYGKLDGLDAHAFQNRRSGIKKLNSKIQIIAKESGTPYIDKENIICSQEHSVCDVLDKDNNLLFYDYGHWTLAGARHFGRKMAEYGSLHLLQSN